MTPRITVITLGVNVMKQTQTRTTITKRLYETFWGGMRVIFKTTSAPLGERVESVTHAPRNRNRTSGRNGSCSLESRMHKMSLLGKREIRRLICSRVSSLGAECVPPCSDRRRRYHSEFRPQVPFFV